MLSDNERQRYLNLRDAGRFSEAMAIVHNQVCTDKPTPRQKLNPKADALRVIMEVGNRMREYACSDVEAAKIRGYEVEQLNFRDKLQNKPSLSQRIRSSVELKEDRYWTLGAIGEIVGVSTESMSNKKVLGAALRDAGFVKLRRSGTYMWYRKQLAM